MKLSQYLDENQLTPAEFGRRILVGRMTISRYLSGDRIPEKEVMAAIFAETRGSVTPNDFYDLSSPENSEAA